jgi:DNA-nicking Smr family endonuclease
MAKPTDPDKPLGQNPFKQLKGFAVPANAAAAKGNQPAPPEAPSTPAAEPCFAEEMRRLGVVPAAGGPVPPEPEPQEEPPDKPQPTPPQTEQELFLSALGRLDATFADDFSLDQAPAAASPRRMKLLRQGKLSPEARLDLHGATREEVRSKVRFFLEDAAYQCKKVVLIITGWGKNSKTEPVLRREVERYLSLDAKAWVVEWGRAPQTLGGEGALVVFLKGS